MHPLFRAIALAGRPAELQPLAFGGGAPSPPPPPPVAPMPDLNDPAVLAAQQQAAQAAMSRSGRLSTILSQGSGSGGTYSGTKLGAQ